MLKGLNRQSLLGDKGLNRQSLLGDRKVKQPSVLLHIQGKSFSSRRKRSHGTMEAGENEDGGHSKRPRKKYRRMREEPEGGEVESAIQESIAQKQSKGELNCSGYHSLK